MTSDLDTGPTSVTLSAAAHRVAAIAAAEAEIPLANWIALAILGTAADQAGIGPQGSSGSPPAATAEAPAPDAVAAALRRLEDKLDRALSGREPAGPQAYD